MRNDAMNGRLDFDNAKVLLQNNGLNVSKAKLTPGYLRSEVAALTTTANYIFPIVNNSNIASTVFNTMRLLPLQDWFIVTQIAIMVAKPSSATDTTFRPVMFPDSTIFTTANTATSLYSMYNGFLNVVIDNEVVINEWDVLRHLFVPVTQGATNAQYATSAITTIASGDYLDNCFAPCQPMVIMNGAADIKFNLVMPAAFAAVETNQRIILELRGIRAQNVTAVR
jgi:hypothetical protein